MHEKENNRRIMGLFFFLTNVFRDPRRGHRVPAPIENIADYQVREGWRERTRTHERGKKNGKNKVDETAFFQASN